MSIEYVADPPYLFIICIDRCIALDRICCRPPGLDTCLLAGGARPPPVSWLARDELVGTGPFPADSNRLFLCS